jgi:hypothetical protein
MATIPTTSTPTVTRTLRVLSVAIGAVVAFVIAIFLLRGGTLETTGHHAADHLMHMPETVSILVVGSNGEHLVHDVAVH